MLRMQLKAYKEDYIKFMVESGALSFGDFVLKSGRRSPFFMNAGAYTTGSQLSTLGEFYAAAIYSTFGDDFDLLFGPAYKGIPLAVSTAIAFSKLFGKEIRYCANRKEAKDHGETGVFLGAVPKDGDRVVLIEDVTTSGKSIDETVPLLLAQAGVKLQGLMVSLDRQEKSGASGNSGKESRTALEEVGLRYGFPVDSIVTMKEAVDYLKKNPVGGSIVITKEIAAAIDKYYNEFGAGK